MNIEEDHNHAVDTILSNKKTEPHCYKYDNEVFTKYKDWDLTQTENHASNDNVNNGGSFYHNYKVMVVGTNDGVSMLNI